LEPVSAQGVLQKCSLPENDAEFAPSSIDSKGRREAQVRNANGLVPTVIEQTNRGERSYDIFSRLLKERRRRRAEIAAL
jgi:hypothetical protein